MPRKKKQDAAALVQDPSFQEEEPATEPTVEVELTFKEVLDRLYPENLDKEGQPLDHGDEYRIGNKVFVRVSNHLAVEGVIKYPENEKGCFEVDIPSFRMKRTHAVHRSRILTKEPAAVAKHLGWSSRMGERLPRPLAGQ